MEGSPNCAERDSVGVADGSALGRCAGPISSYQTCHRRFQQWVRSGTMKGVLETLAYTLKPEVPWASEKPLSTEASLQPKRGIQSWKDKARQRHENYGSCRPPRSARSCSHRECDSTRCQISRSHLGPNGDSRSPSESGSRQRL